jgi:hypothetical protein
MALVGAAVGAKLLDCAFVFRCSPRNWRWWRVVAVALVLSTLSTVVAVTEELWGTRSDNDNVEWNGTRVRELVVRCGCTPVPGGLTCANAGCS